MNKGLNGAGYDLYEKSNDEWILNVKGGSVFVGTFRKVVTHAVTRMGFELDEIDFAVKQMLDKGHNAAHFGMYRSFIFSFQKEFKNESKAS
jgi:hypothetical protein